MSADQDQYDTSVNLVNGGKSSSKGVCTICNFSATRICLHCGQEFCSEHFCPMHETSTKTEPIIDEEGSERNGRRIRLIGEGWPSAMQKLDDMTDDQLREHIAGMQKLLEQAIQSGNYAQISIAAAEYKLSYREHSRYVAAVKRRKKIEQGVLNLGRKKFRPGGQEKKKIPADIAALMKLGGLTYEQALAARALLQAAKK